MSSLHQMLKFLKKDVGKAIRGDQKTARTCYVDLVKDTLESPGTK